MISSIQISPSSHLYIMRTCHDSPSILYSTLHTPYVLALVRVTREVTYKGSEIKK